MYRTCLYLAAFYLLVLQINSLAEANPQCVTNGNVSGLTCNVTAENQPGQHSSLYENQVRKWTVEINSRGIRTDAAQLVSGHVHTCAGASVRAYLTKLEVRSTSVPEGQCSIDISVQGKVHSIPFRLERDGNIFKAKLPDLELPAPGEDSQLWVFNVQTSPGNSELRYAIGQTGCSADSNCSISGKLVFEVIDGQHHCRVLRKTRARFIY